MPILAAVLVGFAVDAVLGDPANLPHTVIFIGKLISSGERLCRRLFPKSAGGKKAAGAFMAVCVVLISGAGAAAVLFFLGKIGFRPEFVLGCVICWQCLAAKCLKDEAMKVQRFLEAGDKEAAGKQISMLVGRDTASLNEEGIIKAAVETVAENTCDGVVAPLFWMLLGGPVLGIMYKAVNTLDSMVGYKNEKYLDFGRFAAKLDDAANFIPARISALAMIAAAYLSGMDGKAASRIWKRDRRKHLSPNSGQTESACAGALGIRLGGDAFYFGQLHKKAALGDALRAPEVQDIKKSCVLMYRTSLICIVFFGLVRFLAIYFLR
ncbi:MAG: cobalamin biosynthesis protein CobD [Firmicutes bacterium]|nr:cobalamin biosynthesis protein CobD [Bacillota bacterium]